MRLMQISVQDTNLKETQKKVKRNYCYVCAIQCTGNKNFVEHKRGKKHLKRLGEQNEKSVISEHIKEGKNTKQWKIIQKNKALKGKFNQSNPENLGPSGSATLESIETTDSNCYSNSKSYNSLETMQTTNSRTNNGKPGNKSFPRHSKSGQMISNHQSRKCYGNFGSYYQDYYYYENHNPHYYEKQQYSYHPPQSNYPVWDGPFNTANGMLPTPNYPNDDIPRKHFANSVYNPGRPFHPNYNPEAECGNFETSHIPSNVANVGEMRQTRPSSSQQKCTLAADDITNSISSLLSEARENVLKDASQPSEKEKTDSINIIQPPDQVAGVQRKRQSMRSRSLSSGDSSCSNDKRKKVESENVPEDKDEAEQQKIKDWTNSLLETSHGEISRLLHPSNDKYKAAVSQLITSLSKSKRKENLSRLKLRSDSMCSSGTNDDDDDKDVIEEENLEPPLHSTEIVSAEESSDGAKGKQRTTRRNKKICASRCSEVTEIHPFNDRIVKRISKSLGKVGKPGALQSDQQAAFLVSSENSSKKERVTSNIILEDSLNTVDSVKKKQRRSATFPEPVDTTCPTDKNLSSTTEHSSIPEASSASPSDASVLKEEVPEASDLPTSASAECISPAQSSASSSEFSVETLISLFASGNVRVKNEYSDPAIDAIKSVDPNVLLDACSSKVPLVAENDVGRQPSLDPTARSRPTPLPDSSSTKEVEKENRNNKDPVSLSSPVVNDTASINSRPEGGLLMPNVTQAEVLDSSLNNPTPSECSFSGVEDINFMPKDKSEYTPELKKLIKDLHGISSQEEMVKQDLMEAKSKINEYQNLLDEWKSKKKMLQVNEENLRKKRNEIIELMQIAVKSNTEEMKKAKKEKEEAPPPTLSSKRPHSASESSEHAELEVLVAKSGSNTPPKKSSKKKTKGTPNPLETEEIVVIPVKVEPPEVIVIDDDSPEEGNHSDDLGESSVTATSSAQSLYDMKNMTVHESVINCMLVFEDFVYTCGNDHTAKRFSIKDPRDMITYFHTVKNVSEIAVEKVQNEALVCTCSTKVISLFIASDGTKIKTFFQSCSIMSICKGWGKFYSGMADGTIYVYNWKYEEKVVAKNDSASRIAAAHQGRLHVLIILSSNGNISIRDAETGLLIRYIKWFVKLPSWMTVHDDLAYLSSSDKTLTILDILTGRSEKKLYVSSHTTGLSVYDDYIFTISYNGIINCYNKDRMSDRKLFYGAGKNGLTCIHVSQNWVFTGNRKGEVSVFHFDPSVKATCQFSQCQFIFGLKDDLAFHVENDHIDKNKKRPVLRCHWGICNFIFPTYWKTEDKMKHMNKHIYHNVVKCKS